MTITHYIPPFTRQNGPKQETVCRIWIRPSEHSNEPTCETCQRWLEQDAEIPHEPVYVDDESMSTKEAK